MSAEQSAGSVYRRLLGYVRPYLGLFLFSIAGWLLYSAMNVAMADILQFVIDLVGQKTEPGAADPDVVGAGIISGWLMGLTGEAGLAQAQLLVPAAMMSIIVIRGLGYFLGSYWMSFVARHVVYDLRVQLFERLIHLPAAFFDRSVGGHLVAKLTYNVEQVAEASSNALKALVSEGLIVIGMVSYMLYINWRLTLVFFAVAPLIALVIAFASRRFRTLSRRIQGSMGEVTHVAQEAVNGYRVMRMFDGEPYERRRMTEASRYNLKQSLKLALTEGLSTPVVQTLVALALGVLVYFALDPTVLGDMTPGLLVAYLTAAGMLAKPIRALTNINSAIQRGVAAATDIFVLVDTPPEPDTGTVTRERIDGAVRFEQVRFAYQKGGKAVLQDIDFAVAPGQTIALVGASGSGKSTLVSLLPRFYRPAAGRITLDGIDLNEFQLANLRHHIAIVSQQVVLFNDSVRNNIAYGDLAQASDAQVREAARAAHALDFIDALPEGFATEVGDNGVMLSGGQRQRIAIARALLKDAPLLILDEATSALDTEAERHIQAALERLMTGRTTFVIAHRLSTVENADQILVLDGGRIVERGSHRDLLQQQGRYAQLHQQQFVDAPT